MPRTNVISKTQTKILSANITTSTVVSDLTFNNLEVGKWYEVKFQAQLKGDSVGSDAICVIDNGGTRIGRVVSTGEANQLHEVGSSYVVKFLATGTSLTFTTGSIQAGDVLAGDGSFNGTFAILSEANGGVPVTTTDFS